MKNFRSSLFRWLALPVLTCFVFILSAISQYFPILKVGELGIGASILLLIIVVVFTLLCLIFRNPIRASIILTLVLLPVFFSFDLQFFFSLFGVGGMVPVGVFCLLVAYAIFRAIRGGADTGRNLMPTYRLLGALVILLMLHQVLYTLFTFSKLDTDRSNYLQADVSVNVNTRMTYALDSLPDIYFIVLDGHTSYASLEKYWGYRNNAFIDSLKRNGFFVAEGARSNYDQTPFSLASTWNMSPLVEKELHLKNSLPYMINIVQTTESNPVAKTMVKLGYDFINLSIFDVAGQPAYFTYGLQTEVRSFSDLLWKRTVFGMASAYAIKSTYNSRFKFTKLFNQYAHLPDAHASILDSLNAIASGNSGIPKFTYAHFMLPHDPYFIDQNGRRVQDKDKVFPEAAEDKKSRYLDQLVYIDRQLEQRIAHILSSSTREPIIIIQGDHGFRELEKREANEEERLSILFAVKVPGEQYNGLSSNVTSMYTFRWLLSEHLGMRLTQRPN